MAQTASPAQAADLLRAGNVGVIPTDTVYGLVCQAADQAAVARLYALKAREHKPGTVVAASIEQLVELGIKARYLKAVEEYWPNPLSIIIPNHELAYIHAGKGGIAMRIPKDEAFLSFLKQTGPLVTTSANQPGEPPANTVAEAQAYFGDEVDFYVDGGDLSGRQPSTLIRIIDDEVEVVREGAVKFNEKGEIIT